MICPKCKGTNIKVTTNPNKEFTEKFPVSAISGNCQKCKCSYSMSWLKDFKTRTDYPYSNEEKQKMKKEFIDAYIECALWSSTDGYNNFLDDAYSKDEIAEETLKKIKSDCESFSKQNMELLKESGQSMEQSGHDFWLTRNKHDAGFWDRGLGEIGDKLTEKCELYGEYHLYIGDDDLIHGQ